MSSREHIMTKGERCWCKDRMQIHIPDVIPITLHGEEVGKASLDDHGRLEVKLEDERAINLLSTGRLHSVSVSSNGLGEILVEDFMVEEYKIGNG